MKIIGFPLYYSGEMRLNIRIRNERTEKYVCLQIVSNSIFVHRTKNERSWRRRFSFHHSPFVSTELNIKIH